MQSRSIAETPGSPARAPGLLTPALFAGVLLMCAAGCSEEPYERAVEAPEAAHDPTQAQGNVPLEDTAETRPEQGEPLQVGEDEVIDPPPDRTAGSPNPEGNPDDAAHAPLVHPSRAPGVDPAGEPMEAAVPDDPTRSMDPTEAPAVDPVDESLVDDDRQ